MKEFYVAAVVVSRHYLCTLMSLSKHIAPQPIAQQPITIVLFMEQSMKPTSLVPRPFEGGKGLGTTACACAKDTVYFPYNTA